MGKAKPGQADKLPPATRLGRLPSAAMQASPEHTASEEGGWEGGTEGGKKRGRKEKTGRKDLT